MATHRSKADEDLAEPAAEKTVSPAIERQLREAELAKAPETQAVPVPVGTFGAPAGVPSGPFGDAGDTPETFARDLAIVRDQIHNGVVTPGEALNWQQQLNGIIRRLVGYSSPLAPPLS